VAVRQELQNLKDQGLKKSEGQEEKKDKSAYTEFAAPFSLQFITVFIRVSQQLWRTPSYIYSKMFLSIIVGLFVGFSFFNSGTSQQGLANQLFSVFLVCPQMFRQRQY
jgi:ATP-binding cassette subfamily G (WHITE) protein 2 (PDR)